MEDSHRENPYRYGVLQGNHVEDRFSLDLVNRQKRKLLPPSTMKDDYRWYNTVLFDKKDDYLKQYPELTPQIYNNKSLKPFLYEPQHITNQQEYRNKPLPEQEGKSSGPREITATLNVCCPQGRTLLLVRR